MRTDLCDRSEKGPLQRRLPLGQKEAGASQPADIAGSRPQASVRWAWASVTVSAMRSGTGEDGLLPVGRGVRPAFGAGSVERAGGEHEAGRCPRFGPAAGVKTRSVQAVSGRCLHPGLGLPTMGDDPCHDRLEVSALGHDRGPLDDGAARGMSSGESSDQGPNRVVVHGSIRRPSRHAVPRPRRAVPARARQRGQLPRSSVAP